MRTFGLLAITFLVCSAFTLAQSNANDTARSPQNSPLSTWRMFHAQGPELDLFHSEDARGVDCFTMRTYTVAREHANSDVTHLVRYSTCPKADWKLQFRNTNRKPPNPDN